MAPPGSEDAMMTIVSKLEENTKMLSDMRLQIMSMDGSLRKLANDQILVETWKPVIDGKVAILQDSVADLKQKVELVITKLPSVTSSSLPSASALGTSASAHLEDPSPTETSGPAGHRVQTDHRGLGVGGSLPLTPAPVKGTGSYPAYTPPAFRNEVMSGRSIASSAHSLGAMVPQVNFPVFDGSNPRIWKKQCEAFFEFYAFPVEMWVRMETMHFDKSALFWLQSMEDRVLAMHGSNCVHPCVIGLVEINTVLCLGSFSISIKKSQ